jgi:hypothetical protein
LTEAFQKTLAVRLAPRIDREKLLVRINTADWPKSIGDRDWIKLKIKSSEIVCRLYDDVVVEIGNKYKKPGFIRINYPLRKKLQITPRDSIQFTITKAHRFLLWYYFIRYHPDDYVRVSTWIGIIAVIISVLLGTVSISVSLILK